MTLYEYAQIQMFSQYAGINPSMRDIISKMARYNPHDLEDDEQ